MDALSGPTDAELVARVLQADRDAFATVYDRYGPRLYDFAYSMLRHREDAADAVADSFVTLAEKLSQLREPDRLRPWLYAIVRSECLRRLKARKRVSYGDDEQLLAMADDAATPEQAAERAMLTQLVWDAAAGLADRDRALLDLHLRQGLDGAELGEAMGVTAANAYVMLNRLRAQVDRSLGALMIARLGRDDCTELDVLLADWDGSFSPLIRKRVARHVDGCEICGERRTKILSPWMLLAGVPVFVAPLTLRDRVLGDTQLVAYSGAPTASSGWSTRAKGAAAAAALVAAASVTAVVWSNGTDPTTVAGAPTPSVLDPSSASSGGALPGLPTPGTTADPTGGPGSATASPSAQPSVESTQLPGTLALSTRSIDLGLTRTSGSVRVSGKGAVPVTFFASSNAAWLSASPSSDTVTGTSSTTMVVTANRGRVAEGTSTGRIQLTWNGGSATITVTLRQENDPVVGRPAAPAGASCSLPVAVEASDDTGLETVKLRWSGPDGTGGTLTMQRSAGRWETTIEPIQLGGPYTLRAIATDSRGNTTTGPALTLDVNPCPG
ncbi:MAG: sigma-70 family RNA polymerase sigma factor [Propionibacteriales bacterium]|nr:sigma-70 family RNA polymerase sigma factor [Propionibacteriales bacterium]